jgi:hypothetical protein
LTFLFGFNFDALFFHTVSQAIVTTLPALLKFDSDFAQTFEANSILLVLQLPRHMN